MEILIKRIDAQAVLPTYGREAGSGIELHTVSEVVVEPGTDVQISTGVAIALPVGYVGFVLDQYGLDSANSIRITPRTIDSGYRQEIFIEVTNVSDETHTFAAGDKIAQIIVQKVERARLIEAEDLGLGETNE